MNFIAIALYTLSNPFENPESVFTVEISKFENGIKILSFERLVKPENLENYFLNEEDGLNDELYLELKDAPTFAELWNSELKDLLNGELPITFSAPSKNNDLDINILKTLFQNYAIKHQPIKYFDYWEITQRTWKKFRDGDFYLAKYYIDDVPRRWFSDSPREKLRAFLCLDSDKEKWLTNTETAGEIVLLAAKEKGCKNIDELLATCGMEMKVLE